MYLLWQGLHDKPYLQESNPEQTGSAAHSQSQKHLPCRILKMGKACTLGVKCPFAHGEHERRMAIEAMQRQEEQPQAASSSTSSLDMLHPPGIDQAARSSHPPCGSPETSQTSHTELTQEDTADSNFAQSEQQLKARICICLYICKCCLASVLLVSTSPAALVACEGLVDSGIFSQVLFSLLLLLLMVSSKPLDSSR